MKKTLLTLSALAIQGICLNAYAQKQVYIPQQLFDEGYSETDASKKWCKLRSRESDNIIVFWENSYGTNDPNSSAVDAAYRVDVDDLLKKLESFYDLNINKLKFAEVGNGKSQLDKYKMVICLYYTTDWMAYGSGFDNRIGGMWISPSTCHPVGSTIAHEIGHSFQYQCFCDYAPGQDPNNMSPTVGYRYQVGQGTAFWEQTAQWQSFQAYPEQVFSPVHYDVYMNNYHRAISNEWMRYASYFFHYYLAQKHGIDIIGRIWRQETPTGKDPFEVYMDMTGTTNEDFYKECFDAAMHLVTWDVDGLRNYASGPGEFKFNYVDCGNGKLQVAYASCPQGTGYNVIPLQVPAAGTTVSTAFTALPAYSALAEGDPGKATVGENTQTVTKYNTFANARTRRGFRHGYVALLKDGSRVYHSVDSVYATGNLTVSDTTQFTIPEGTQKLWFVVAPALSKYISHKWNENETDDDQWPYQVEFMNTDVVGHVKIDNTKEMCDTTLNVYVGFKAGNSYEGTSYKMDEKVMTAIGSAFHMQPADIAQHFKAWNATMQEGDIMLWGVKANQRLYTQGYTANEGYWFSNDNNVNTYANGYVFVEFNASTLTFTIGQNPGKCKNNEVYKPSVCLRYKKDGKFYRANIVFNTFIGGVPSGIEGIDNEQALVDVYNLNGVCVRQQVAADKATDGLPQGVYIVDGKKVMVK